VVAEVCGRRLQESHQSLPTLAPAHTRQQLQQVEVLLQRGAARVQKCDRAEATPGRAAALQVRVTVQLRGGPRGVARVAGELLLVTHNRL